MKNNQGSGAYYGTTTGTNSSNLQDRLLRKKMSQMNDLVNILQGNRKAMREFINIASHYLPGLGANTHANVHVHGVSVHIQLLIYL